MAQPKLRIKGFDGEWETRTFGSLGTVAMCKRIFKDQTSNHGYIPFYKIGTFGSTPDAFISREIYEEYKKKYEFPQKGDILISAAGTIGRVVEYLGEDAYYQDSNIVWLKHNDEIENSFLKYLYSIITWKGLEGATIKRLYNNIFLGTEIKMPSKKEQYVIASYFHHLDSLIQSTIKKFESIKQVKVASLQSMFPQGEERVPRVRFKGFEGEWVIIPVGELGVWSKGRLLSKSDITTDGGTPCIHYGELFVNYREVIDKVVSYTNINNGCYSDSGDILFPDSDVTPTGLARCSALMVNKVLLGGGINILKVKKMYYSPFVSYSINQEKGQIISRVTGTTVRHISSTALSEVLVKMPTDKDEQKMLADYFSLLDSQISIQEQRLEKLKQIKAACLEKMFV